MTALVIAKGGLNLDEAAARPAAPPPSEREIVHVGGIQTVRAALPDGGYTLTNPRIGTVRVTAGAGHSYRWQAPSTTLAGLADLLNDGIGFVPGVVDLTGAKGNYEIDLKVSLADAFSAAATTPADIQDALLKSFNRGLAPVGLQLQLRKAPVEIIVVDRVERAPTGN